MNAKIEHLLKDDKGNVVYKDKKPQTTFTTVLFPIRFGYGNYNQPKKVLGPYNIDVEDILSIEPV